VIHGQLTDANGGVVVAKVMRTVTALERARGLLGRRLDPDAGMLLEPCASVHTFGMRFPLDLVYLDRNWMVVKLVTQVVPWRLSFCLQARFTLELCAGHVDQVGLKCGMRLQWNSCR
jgi:uncharacterized membrane protein (UPF0127 family)